MPTAITQKLIRNPEFFALSFEEQRKVLLRVEPDFKALSRGEQNRVIQGLLRFRQSRNVALAAGREARTFLAPALGRPTARERFLPEARPPSPEVESVAQRRLGLISGLATIGGLAAGGIPGAAAGRLAVPIGMSRLQLLQRMLTQPGLPRIVAGGMLGAGGGSALADVITAEEAARGRLPPDVPVPTVPEQIERAEREMLIDLTFAGLPVAAAFPAQRALARFAGVPEAGRQLAERAAALGVEPGMEQVTRRGFIRGARTVVGRFPIVGVPFARSREKLVDQIFRARDTLAASVGPLVSKAALSKIMTRRAQEIVRILFGEESRLFRIAREGGALESVAIPTNPIRRSGTDFIELLSRDRPLVATVTAKGDEIVSEMPRAIRVPAERIAKSVSGLSGDAISVGEAQFILQQLNDLEEQSLKRGLSLKGIKQIRLGVFQAMDQATGDRAAVQALRSARRFSAQLRSLLETPTARAFGRGEARVFLPVAGRPGGANLDEVFDFVFNAGSADAIRDLRRLVDNDRVFGAATRAHLDDVLERSFDRADGRTILNLDRMARQLGLGREGSNEFLAFREMLRGTGTTPEDFQELITVARNVFGTPEIDVSAFVARRGMLAGLRGVVRAVPSIGRPATGPGRPTEALGPPLGLVMTVLGMRGLGALVTRPGALRLAIRSLDPDLSAAQRRAAMGRLTRIFGSEAFMLGEAGIERAREFAPARFQLTPEERLQLSGGRR